MFQRESSKEGFRKIYKAYSGAEGIAMCKKNKPDIIILDIMLPDIDGIEVCKSIRQFSYCSVLLLSAKDSDVDKILGLSIGGDDYITKPFSPREIAFRIRAQIRRRQYDGIGCNRHESEVIKIGTIEIDKSSGQVFKKDNEVKLTAKEFKLLLYLAENPNKIISKERLCEVVWGEDYFGYKEPKDILKHYAPIDMAQLYRTGGNIENYTMFVGSYVNNNKFLNIGVILIVIFLATVIFASVY